MLGPRLARTAGHLQAEQFADLKTHQYYDPYRLRPAFQELLTDLEFPSDQFVRPGSSEDTILNS